MGRPVAHCDNVRLTNNFKLIIAMVSDVGEQDVIRTSRCGWGNIVKQALKTRRYLVLE